MLYPQQELISFTYEGHERIVEPHLLGAKRGTGNVALSAWQVGGYSESESEPPWRNYLLDELSGLTVLDEIFSGDRPGYNPNDRTMEDIYCHL